MKPRHTALTSGPIFKLLMKLTWPMIMGIGTFSLMSLSMGIVIRTISRFGAEAMAAFVANIAVGVLTYIALRRVLIDKQEGKGQNMAG